MICLLFLAAAFLLCLSHAQELVGFFTGMGEEYGYSFVYLSPQELLLEYFSVSLVAAVVLCLPVFAWHLWNYARPGLEKWEGRAFAAALSAGLLFFLMGVLFAGKIPMPFILCFLIRLNEGTGIAAAVSIQSYMSFLLTVLLIFGITFEFPVLSVILTGAGLIKSSLMKKGRKPAVVLIFILAALITPPDVVSQVIVALPMIVLYELGIWLSVACERMKKNNDNGFHENPLLK